MRRLSFALLFAFPMISNRNFVFYCKNESINICRIIWFFREFQRFVHQVWSYQICYQLRQKKSAKAFSAVLFKESLTKKKLDLFTIKQNKFLSNSWCFNNNEINQKNCRGEIIQHSKSNYNIFHSLINWFFPLIFFAFMIFTPISMVNQIGYQTCQINNY